MLATFQVQQSSLLTPLHTLQGHFLLAHIGVANPYRAVILNAKYIVSLLPAVVRTSLLHALRSDA
jgi:hypothetical protein